MTLLIGMLGEVRWFMHTFANKNWTGHWGSWGLSSWEIDSEGRSRCKREMTCNDKPGAVAELFHMICYKWEEIEKPKLLGTWTKPFLRKNDTQRATEFWSIHALKDSVFECFSCIPRPWPKASRAGSQDMLFSSSGSHMLIREMSGLLGSSPLGRTFSFSTLFFHKSKPMIGDGVSLKVSHLLGRMGACNLGILLATLKLSLGLPIFFNRATSTYDTHSVNTDFASHKLILMIYRVSTLEVTKFTSTKTLKHAETAGSGSWRRRKWNLPWTMYCAATRPWGTPWS